MKFNQWYLIRFLVLVSIKLTKLQHTRKPGFSLIGLAYHWQVFYSASPNRGTLIAEKPTGKLMISTLLNR